MLEQILQEQLALAERLAREGQQQAAVERAVFVVRTLDAQFKTQVWKGRLIGALAGFILGALVPVAQFVLAPLGAYLGFRWGGNVAEWRFMLSPAAVLYEKAINVLYGRK